MSRGMLSVDNKPEAPAARNSAHDRTHLTMQSSRRNIIKGDPTTKQKWDRALNGLQSRHVPSDVGYFNHVWELAVNLFSTMIILPTDVKQVETLAIVAVSQKTVPIQGIGISASLLEVYKL